MVFTSRSAKSKHIDRRHPNAVVTLGRPKKNVSRKATPKPAPKRATKRTFKVTGAARQTNPTPKEGCYAST